MERRIWNIVHNLPHSQTNLVQPGRNERKYSSL